VFKACSKQKSFNGFLGLLDLKFFTISNADSLPNETVDEIRGLCLELFRKIPHKNAEIHGFCHFKSLAFLACNFSRENLSHPISRLARECESLRHPMYDRAFGFGFGEVSVSDESIKNSTEPKPNLLFNFLPI
jgi:hypothetical protein